MNVVWHYAKGILWSLASVTVFWVALRYGLATRIGQMLFMFAYFATHKDAMVPHAGGGMYYEQLWFWLCIGMIFSATLLLYVWKTMP